MADLLDYLNGAAHAPLIQAAVVHAQFETIHPFTDGNGRVGRVLIHTVLARRGATQQAVLPISLVLATLRDRYIAGPGAYRHEAVAGSAAASAAVKLTRILDVSFPAATAALEELRQAGILRTKAIERGATANVAGEVLDLVTPAERALASTKFDTRAAAPVRPVPAIPGA